MELACTGQYQDALILNLMYSFSSDPYHIYSLTFDGIININQIQYWHYISLTKKVCFLYYELWNDINTIKRYQEKENNQVRKTLRVMIDKTTIRGKFLISISPTNIYKRFNKKFWK